MQRIMIYSIVQAKSADKQFYNKKIYAYLFLFIYFNFIMYLLYSTIQ